MLSMEYSEKEVSRRFIELMNAYRECLSASDKLPSTQVLDKILTQHVISTSSRQASVFIKTRLKDSEKFYEAICSFQRELQTEDLLSQILGYVKGEITAKLGILTVVFFGFALITAFAKFLVGVIGGIANSMIYGMAIWYIGQYVLPAMATIYENHTVARIIREKLEKSEKDLWALTGARPPHRPVLAMAALLPAGIAGAIGFLPVFLASIIF